MMLRLASLLIIAGAAAGQAAVDARPTEYQVKAAYLYNFGKFVTWPASEQQSTAQPFTVCVLGGDPFGASLEATIAGATIGDRRIQARRITDASDASRCQIVFIASSEAGKLEKILPVIAKAHALTVSDMPRFIQRGGMIQFVLDGGRVRFEVNLTAAQNAGLTLSSELLKVAAAVKKIPLETVR